MNSRRDDRRSPEAELYRRWYKSARWLKIRQAQLSEHPLCNRHLKQGRVVKANTVHHVHAHKGDVVLFYSGPFESLCDECHNSHAQSEERRGYSTEIGADGWPVDPKHPSNRTPSRRPI